ncbi:MAG: hypothetical protein L3J36_10750 [Rhodobacteraceae bacterium]|nr:hypothetical protein [Paracoccaceae bacterium]
MDKEQATVKPGLRANVKINYHFGAPFAENDHLIWSLRKDTILLAENRVSAPRPKKFKTLIPKAISDLEGNFPTLAEQDKFFDFISSGDPVDRIILSNPNFIGAPTWMLSGGKFFPNAGRNIYNIHSLLPDNPSEYFIGISNPVTCLSAAFGAQTSRSNRQFFNNVELDTIRWSTVIQSIQQVSPGTPITVWCDEETPIIWPTILREISGIDPQVEMAGDLDIIKKIMSKEGGDRMEAYLQAHPKLNELQRRRVKDEFLRKFVLESAVEKEIDLKGWTDDTVDAMTDIYEDDIDFIDQMPGVTLISA